MECSCVLCLQQGDQPSLGKLEKIGTRRNRAGHRGLWAHSECLYYASRKNPNEADIDLLTRVIHHALLCKLCKKKRASVGCLIETCKYICHYPCAIGSGGEYVENEGFYCPNHVELATRRLFALCKWPNDMPVRFLSENIWDGIAKEDCEFISLNREKWEEYTPSFLQRNLTSKVHIQEIKFGHWAYCTNLKNMGIEKQYEVRASVHIEKDEMIGEYVGRVRYQKDITDSHYVANFWYPEDMEESLGDKQLCIDAEFEGNEMRFVNSVAPTTAFYIKQNATMSTVWCRNQLRVVMIATRNILKGQPIIVNYNEFSSSFFEENMPFLPQFTIEIPPIPRHILASGKKSGTMAQTPADPLVPQQQDPPYTEAMDVS